MQKIATITGLCHSNITRVVHEYNKTGRINKLLTTSAKQAILKRRMHLESILSMNKPSRRTEQSELCLKLKIDKDGAVISHLISSKSSMKNIVNGNARVKTSVNLTNKN